MPRFTKKPVTIEAIQYTGDNVQEIWDAFGAGEVYGPTEETTSLRIDTLEGPHEAPPGWWIIRGVAGELYPRRPDIFDQTYVPAED